MWRKRTLELSMALRQLDLLGYLLVILLSSINTSAHLNKLDYDSHNLFKLSEGLYDCTLEDTFPLLLERRRSAVDVHSIEAKVYLCCPQGSECEPCLQVLLNLTVTNEEDLDDGEVDDPEEETSAEGEEAERATYAATSQKPAILNLCYTIAQRVTCCHMVECAVHFKRESPYQSEWFGVLLKPGGLTPGSTVYVTVDATSKVNKTITIPTEATVCTGSRRSEVKGCVDPPQLSTVVDLERREVRIGATEDKTHAVNVSMCLKSERAGICKSFPGTIPLHAVSPCLCIQVWWQDKDGRSETCLFNNTRNWNIIPAKKTALDFMKELRQNVLANISRSVVLSQTHSGLLALSWNVSVPCQVKVDVRLCRMGAGGVCEDVKDERHLIQEGNDAWISNTNGSWRISGAFVNVSAHLPHCIKMEVMGEEMYPWWCQKYTRRWHWSIPIFAVVLLFSLVIFSIYLKRTTLEKWLQKSQRSLLQGGRGHVLLLHPPCEDPSTSELVCLLGSTLKSLGFSVSLDLWSHTELGAVGPVPWLHSQMELLQTRGGRALVVLSHTALKRAEEWSWLGWRGVRGGSFVGTDLDGGQGPPSPCSPPADVFSAGLSCLLEDHQRGCALRRFSLVQFDSHSPFTPGKTDAGLPLLFQGLSMYRLPTDSRAFLDAIMQHGGVLVRSRRWQSRWLSRALMRRLQSTNDITGECFSQILENSGETAPLQPRA
ncbi:uncharacterized protein il17rc isoform X1 [Clupea harengus]|uniref:Uncharacterized protein il17rc isoform X1 n=2 Tax=Clupea harengus TaxID=7950 RepID=A0A6P8FKR0_CLUHA|nr:uncharacterized protein il17rc isoform X1 [Clupea harengus]